MRAQHLLAAAGSHSLAQLIARRAIPVGCALGLALSGPALAVVAQPGAQLGNEFPVNTETSGDQALPVIAVDADGDFVVAWESDGQDGDSFGIYAQRYTVNGSPAGTEFPVNTFTTGSQQNPVIAVDADGGFVVAWESDGQDGDGFGIYAQRYDANGSPAGSEFKVNTFTTGAQQNPAIAMDADGDFVIAWQSSGQDGSGSGIYAQRYMANGTATDSEFLVNTVTAGSQGSPALAMDAAGEFVVAWESNGQDGSGFGVYAQRYMANGTKDGTEFPVNTETSNDQRVPALAMDADGDFVVAWQSNAQDGSGYGIYARHFDATGSTPGTEFPVNTFTMNDQDLASVAMDAGGDFVIAWESAGQDTSSDGVYAQRYMANGTKDGTEFQVNTFTTGAQADPAIALDADGDFVVAWNSDAQDGSGYGIYAQRFVGPEDVDLAVTVTDSPDPVAVGNTLTYTLTVDNNHNVVAPTGVAAIDNAIGSATGVTAKLALAGPPIAAGSQQGVDVPPGSGVTCAPDVANPDALACTIPGALAAGTNLSIGVRVQLNPAGPAIATANATGNQFDSNEGQTTDNNTQTEQTTVNAAGAGGGTAAGPTGHITSIGKDGGCSMSAVPGKPDPTLPVLGFLAGLVLVMRRRLGAWRTRVGPSA